MLHLLSRLPGIFRFTIYPTHPCDRVLHALSRLPALQELKISFYPDGSTLEGIFFPSYIFPKLSALQVAGIDPSIVDSLQAMLSKHAEGLESLTLRTPSSYSSSTTGDNPLVLTLAALLPPSLPRLTSLTFNSGQFRLQAPSLSASPSLSHLVVENAIGGTVGASFWRELSKEGIQLKTLSIYPITAPILEYLRSYSGLVKLLLVGSPYTSRPREPIRDDVKGKVYSEALTMHRTTLRHLAYVHLPWKRYGITEERLQGVLECKHLETLWLTYHFPDHVPKEVYSDGWDDGEDEDIDEGEDDASDEGTDDSSSTMDMV